MFGSALILASVAPLSSARAQAVISAPAGASSFGRAVANVGDLDGDGLDDLAVSGLTTNSLGGNEDACWIYTGPPATPLWMVSVPRTTPGFSLQIESPGDLNGDGVPEVIYGSPGNFVSAGAAVVVDGAGGFILAQIPGSTIGTQMGSALAVLGDTTGDGTPDFAASGIGGEVLLVDGAMLLPYATVAGGFGFGAELEALDDLDGDGARELAIVDASFPGGTTVVSGSNGIALGLLPGPVSFVENLGFDYFGDGRSEILALDPVVTNTMTLLDSAATATPLTLSLPPSLNYGVGREVGIDWSADGIPDLWFGSPVDDRVDLVDGASGTLFGSFVGVPGENYGVSLASGDFDGNGSRDMAVGTFASPGRVVIEP